MLKRNHELDITGGNIATGVLAFALPVIVTNVLQMLYNAADMIVVGRFCGDESLAAVGATGAVTNLVINLFIGFGAGVSALVSRYIGARDRERAHDAVHTSVALALVCGVVLAIFGVVFSRSMLHATNTPDNVIDYAALYMQIVFVGTPANLMYNFGAAILRSMGDTKRPLYFLTLSGIINVLLNLFFVIVFNMNVAGVALATIISQYISAALVIVTLLRSNSECRLIVRDVRFHLNELKLIIAIGLPAGLQTSMYSVSNVLIQSSVNSFGSKAMSGFSAGSNIFNFANAAMDAFTATAIVYVAQNFGARNFGRIRTSANICFAYTFAMGTVMGFAIVHFGPALIGIYAPGNAEVVTLGMKYMIMFKYITGFGGANGVATSALRGMGRSFVPMAVSIGGICVFRVIWIMSAFAKWHTLEMIYVSYPISWVITALTNIVLFYCVWNKLRKAPLE